MNKNYQTTRYNKTQISFQNKFVQGNKADKNSQLPKSKEKVKHLENNKQRFKPNNKVKNNNSNNKANKNNNRMHSRSKSKSRKNNQNSNKIAPSINNEKIGNSAKTKKEIPSNNNKDKKENSNNTNTQMNFLIPVPIESKIKSDLNNPNFFKPNRIKIDLKKISDNTNMEEELLKSTTNFENLKGKYSYDISSLFEEWEKISALYKVFEKSILKQNNFVIDKETLEIKTKNADSCNKLKDQKFWILYIEYLIKNSLLVNEKQFLSVMDEAFSYMQSNTDCIQLRMYYLEKVKKYSPCFHEDGTLIDKDEAYLKKLKKPNANLIMNEKEAISSNIKIKNSIKIINKSREDNKNESNNLPILLTENGINPEGKKGGDGEVFEIIKKSEK